MRKWIILFIVLGLAACTQSQEPPLPGTKPFNPLLGMAYTHYNTFGHIRDQYATGAKPLVFTIDQDQYPVTPGGTFTMDIGVDHEKVFENIYISTGPAGAAPTGWQVLQQIISSMGFNNTPSRQIQIRFYQVIILLLPTVANSMVESIDADVRLQQILYATSS